MRFLRNIFAVLLVLFAAQASAAGGGVEYKLLNPPQPTSGGSKVEVLEFFFYECPHCYHLHIPLTAWENEKKKQNLKGVDLQFVPVIFRETSEPLARAYYALESMGQIARLHNDLFEALHVFNIDLSDEAKITEFVGKHGVDKAQFGAAYNSFTVDSKVQRAKQMVRSYQIRGTPTLVVDGKYVISDLQPDDTVRVLRQVIEIARKERVKH
ncbi:MAG: thiol:disulfide interchange protein DsbA/DsbL [Sideroxydans sp.]|nr:thiol:disulfide interchange protein DsbA/DsbL [Sideroxydans sp.]